STTTTPTMTTRREGQGLTTTTRTTTREGQGLTTTTRTTTREGEIELTQVCAGLAVRSCDVALYNGILEKLKREINRKGTKAVSKSMKYVMVLDFQTGIPLYRAYENGAAILYDPIYPVPNPNFLWISEYERTQGEKEEVKLSLQRCKKVPGLYYPK